MDNLTTPTPPEARRITPDCHGLDTPQRVCFYEQDFYVLSNFSAFQIAWDDGLIFPTSEHVYHWEKFNTAFKPAENETQRRIREATSAHEAFKIAERHRATRRPNWDSEKVAMMRTILRAKAQQHEYVRRKLLATGKRELVENSWRDDFWGWGPNCDGQNMLGKLWMEIRAEMRAANAIEGIWPTAPTQPPAPLAGGTALQPSTATAEVAAGCKEGRPATGEREAELREAIRQSMNEWHLHGSGHIIDAILTGITPLLDRREAELSQQWRLSSVCREKQLDIDALHQQLHITEEQVAALRTLVAKKDEALKEIQRQALADSPEERRIIATSMDALALTPATIADELTAKEARIKELETLAVVRWNTIEGEERRIAARDAEIARLKEVLVQLAGDEDPEKAYPLQAQLTAAHTHMDKLREHRNDLDAACHELEGKLRESEAARASLQEQLGRARDEYRNINAAYQQLSDDHSAVLTDAERYRHLRANWDKWTGTTWHRGNIAEKLDAAVDAARAQEARP